MHERREALPSAARAHAAGAIAAHAEALLALLPSNPAPVVSSYWAIGPELDAVSLEAAIVARGGSLCLPVMVGKGKPLLFRAYCHGDALSPRTWGIQEPLATADEALPDLLLVPSLALDRRGHRLGYGGGFYDRTLAMLRARRPTVAVGLCYDEQVSRGRALHALRRKRRLDTDTVGPVRLPVRQLNAASRQGRPLRA